MPCGGNRCDSGEQIAGAGALQDEHSHRAFRGSERPNEARAKTALLPLICALVPLVLARRGWRVASVAAEPRAAPDTHREGDRTIPHP
jgi:hypothetical protein